MRHALAQGHSGTLAEHDERQRAAADLAGDNHDLALAGLLFGRAAVGAILLAVRLPDPAAEIGAVDRNRAGEIGLIGVEHLRTDRLAELMSKHERRFVLDVEIAAQL